MRRGGGFAWVLVGAMLILGAWAGEARGVCDRMAHTRVEVNVHKDVPRFSTGQGWVVAPQIARLPNGTTVRICEERWVGFIGGKKLWIRILFGQNQEGWIYGEGTITASGERHPGSRAAAWPWPREAFAQSEAGSPEPGAPGSWSFYFMAFAVVCLGMVAKGLFDRLDHGRFSWSSYLRKTVRALLVSPIVFMGFASVGDFELQTTASLLIFLSMAFQNGFFWQTVLVKVGKLK